MEELTEIWQYMLSKRSIEQLSTHVNTPCWVLPGKAGIYRTVTYGFVRGTVHRISCAVKIGRWVNVDMEVAHLCRVRHCWNPEHLEETPPSKEKAKLDYKVVCQRKKEKKPIKEKKVNPLQPGKTFIYTRPYGR